MQYSCVNVTEKTQRNTFCEIFRKLKNPLVLASFSISRVVASFVSLKEILFWMLFPLFSMGLVFALIVFRWCQLWQSGVWFPIQYKVVRWKTDGYTVSTSWLVGLIYFSFCIDGAYLAVDILHLLPLFRKFCIWLCIMKVGNTVRDYTVNVDLCCIGRLIVWAWWSLKVVPY